MLLIIEKKLIDYIDEVENTFDLLDPIDNEIVQENKILKQIIEQEMDWWQKEKLGFAWEINETEIQLSKLNKFR